ncbi:hypothetical protein F5B18DRAFT_605047 [Nemania serpens]|nr:hypothetical protein F5B18DRAFT_605047 [Nemania serpens]
MATTLALQSAPPDVFARISELQKEQSPASACAPVEWSSNTLTLSNLRRLARTLNPSDSELAPVQAWYELARLYGVVVATDPAVLAGLERALAGEVQCVVFGAVVRRNVFEDALERVVGLVPRRWDGEIGLEGEVVDFGGEEVQGGDGEGMEMEMEDEDEMADEMAATQGEKKRTGAGSGILGRLIHTAKGRK